MKRITVSLLSLAFAMVLCMGALALDTIYVSDNGKFDGTSADMPTSSLDDAITALSDGGTIVITDRITLNDSYYEPLHDGEITITGGSIVFNHADYSRYYLSGPTKFENIKFTFGETNSRKTAVFLGRYFPLTFGEGINSSDLSVYVVGGYQHPVMDGDNMTSSDIITDRDSKVTINSGTYNLVAAFSRGNSSVAYTGTAHVTVNGGTIKSLYGASVNGSYSGSTKIEINGGTVTALYTGGDSTRRLNGDAEVKVNGGTVSALSINNVMGHATLYYLGGKIGSVSKSVAENIREFVTDGKATLTVRKGQNVSEFYSIFDTATYEDGSTVTGAADFESASYTLLDKVPAETNALGAKVYVASVGNGDGFSPESPISDLKEAYSLLSGIDGAIILMNEIDLSDANFYEPEHENTIILTSFDGEKYFDGGINTGKSRRFYFSGNTVIENTKLNFQSTALYVGRFNDVTFGTGIDTVGSGDLYALAGHQFGTTDEVREEVGSTLTVKSGSFYCVLGYTRGSGGTYTFKGTQTVNLLGGTVRRVYGGVVQSNVSDNVVINIDGATVTDFIQVGGDQSNHSNNAVVNMKSGSVQQLDMRNVLVSTTVNWTGGEIGSFACDNCMYNGVRNEEAYAAANEYKDATYTLNYSGVTPSADALKFFTTVNDSVASSTEVKLTIGSTTAYINGEAQTLDAAPINRNNRTMLPVRFLANAFGVANEGIKWDAATRTATLTNSEVTIVVTIDAPTMTVNGETVALDSPAIIEQNRTYLPVRAIANALGVSNDNIKWDGATSTATLIK